MEKIRFQLADEMTCRRVFYVRNRQESEEYRIFLYRILWKMNASAYILKDVSKDTDPEACYEMLEDDDELSAVLKFLNKCLKTWILKCKKHTIRNRRH